MPRQVLLQLLIVWRVICVMANGHEVAFAIMNQNVLSGAKARAFQDAVCDEVIRGR